MGQKDDGRGIAVGDKVCGSFGGMYTVAEVRDARVLVGCVGLEFKSYNLTWDASRGWWR